MKDEKKTHMPIREENADAALKKKKKKNSLI